MRDRAVRLSVANRWPGGPPRRVHQNGGPIARGEPLEDSRRRIALHASPLRLAKSGLVDEAAQESDAFSPCSERAIAGIATLTHIGSGPRRKGESDVEPVGRQRLRGTVGPFH